MYASCTPSELLPPDLASLHTQHGYDTFVLLPLSFSSGSEGGAVVAFGKSSSTLPNDVLLATMRGACVAEQGAAAAQALLPLAPTASGPPTTTQPLSSSSMQTKDCLQQLLARGELATVSSCVSMALSRIPGLDAVAEGMHALAAAPSLLLVAASLAAAIENWCSDRWAVLLTCHVGVLLGSDPPVRLLWSAATAQREPPFVPVVPVHHPSLWVEART